MHFLECIAMLHYLEKKLKVNQRVQVPADIHAEILGVLVQITKKLEGTPAEKGMASARINDLIMALNTVKETPGLLFLPDKMKAVLVDGIQTVKDELCVLAYKYYTINNIPDSMCRELDKESSTGQSPKEILREVAKVAISRELYKQ